MFEDFTCTLFQLCLKKLLVLPILNGSLTCKFIHFFSIDFYLGEDKKRKAFGRGISSLVQQLIEKLKFLTVYTNQIVDDTVFT